MTPAQVRQAMIPLVRALVKSTGRIVEGFDGLENDLGQLTIRTPAGSLIAVTLPISLPVLLPLQAFVADAESRIRLALRPFGGASGRGFGPRGTLPVAEPGTLANDGWV